MSEPKRLPINQVVKTRRPRDYVEGTVMTADQLDRWMKAMTRTERLFLIDAMQAAAERGHNCWAMDHEGRLEETEHRLVKTLEANARLKQSAMVL